MDREIPKSEIRKQTALRWLKFGVPAVVAVGAIGWGLGALSGKSVDGERLRFATVNCGDIETTVNGNGKVVPAFEEIINSPVSSRIIEVCHRPGDVVKAGTPLLVLDLVAAKTDYGKQLDQLKMKKLELEQLLANNNTSLSSLAMQIKVGEMKVRRLEAEFQNERYLDSIGSGTTDKVREAEFALRSEELGQEQLRQKYDNELAVHKAEADVKRLEIEIMEKELSIASRTLGDAEIRSPRRATITSITQMLGQQVSQGEQVAVIADLGHYKIEAEAPDTYAKLIQAGSTAKIKLGNSMLEGRVSSVTPTSVNGIVSFSVSLDNDTIPALRAGLRTNVYVGHGLRKDAMRLPNGPYYTKPGNYKLFVEIPGSNTLERREVTLGESSYEYVEVLSGLSEGEKVVLSDMSAYNTLATVKLK